jgi:UDP-N-acetylglucosamine 2-epimerase (non-hydrolysing)
MAYSIVLVAGARPNFMKIAPIMGALKAYEECNFSLVHTGQHYDEKMSERFFKQLDIPMPSVNLEAGGGSQAEQTATIMVKFEQHLIKKPCDLVLVVGDVTSTLACSIVAKKLLIKVAHVEGGIRSGDLTMPEEINRLVTDSIADYFFTTTLSAGENLLKEGKHPDQIFFVGNTMIDTLLKHEHRFTAPDFWSINNLTFKNYFVLTLHRPSNVDNPEQLTKILKAIKAGATDKIVIFPVHPRTRKNMELFGLLPNDGTLLLVEPQGYLEFNYLVKHALGVITDSGGITEETTVMGIPCMTLRDTTERPETCAIGTNELIGTDPSLIELNLRKMVLGQWKKGGVPALWDGKTSERIAEAVNQLLSS